MGGNKGRVRVVKKKTKAAPPKPRDKPKRTPAVVLAACYFCNKKVDEQEYLCGGCNEVICEKCDRLAPPSGDHMPEEHQAEADDDGGDSDSDG
jgi:hypothetical protein